jgi:superfamily II DNA or RNA helicase
MGRVRLLRYEPDEAGLIAIVRGKMSPTYEVVLDWRWAASQQVVFADCKCAAADRGLCKHIWATVLEADRMSLSGRVPGSGKLDLELGAEAGFVRGRNASANPRPGPPRTRWQHQLDQLDRALQPSLETYSTPPIGELWLLAVLSRRQENALTIEIVEAPMLKSGKLGKLRPATVRLSELGRLPALLQPAIEVLGNLAENQPWSYGSYRSPVSPFSSASVPFGLLPLLLPRLCATRRFAWKPAQLDLPPRPLRWDDGPPWTLVVRGEAGPGKVALRPQLERDGTLRPLATARMMLGQGVVLFEEEAARLDAGPDFGWLRELEGEGGALEIPLSEMSAAVERLLASPLAPRLRLPAEHLPPIETVTGQPVVQILPLPDRPLVLGRLAFDYPGHRVGRGEPRPVFPRPGGGGLLQRDAAAEQAVWDDLLNEGWQEQPDGATLPLDVFPAEIARLAERGVGVELEGKQVRAGRHYGLSVASGIDWFDLSGEVEFGEGEATLPELLQAVRERRRFLTLKDGSLGLLPAEWLQRLAPLAELAGKKSQGEPIRFEANQALVLDALLASQPAVRVDKIFNQVRERLRSFERLERRSPPPSFRGELRPYQELGLAWLELLSELGLGGCLADEMGLGKTVQVLAFLADRKRRRQAKGKPSLLVVPASLVHNWAAEATRFTPTLRFGILHGPERHSVVERPQDYDVLVTTYATLRRDLDQLLELELDVAVLDEAQAIKNGASQTAKACRLLRARHRLALTGTPVENHLGELWSLFEFLNPGLLGQLPSLAEHAGKVRLPPEALAAVAAALKPLILRRTKRQVITELPEKTEQTLVCELLPAERKHYDQLRRHYRAQLDKSVKAVGLGRSKILVLEALLRLRQAACHPYLLGGKAHEASAKLELLLEQLGEVVAGGNKALVFSQFVQLLTVVRQRLETKGIPFEYLDGRTKDRQEKVDRFQGSNGPPVFLISLKAGGVGLNLTSASYVYLLDPWWNPAVEAQAIDRTHRIGQTQPVFAYRLIAQDTVEEKILALQDEKRDLAEAILGADQRLMKQLTIEDLERLLG